MGGHVGPVEQASTPFAQRRVVYRFAASAGPMLSGTLTERVPADGTVERLRVRIYAGAELALRITPRLVRRPDRREDLVSFVGKAYIDGDDDVFDFSLAVPVFVDDVIEVAWENTVASYSYDFAVDIEVDHAGGAWRPQVVGAHG